MEIRILGRNVSLSASQQELVERRTQYALNRFSTQIRTVQVTLSDVNGPKGGSDILCRFKVQLRKQGEILVGDTDVCIESAVANVADRAARSLARLLDRQREHQGISMSGAVEA